jgi:hypothetical protein
MRLALFVLIVMQLPAFCLADAREVVEKAIVAHGGETNLAKLKSVRIKVEGEAELAPGQPAVSIVVEDVWQMPDRYKTTSRTTLGGQPFTQTLCINETGGWAQINGQVQALPEAGLKEIKEQKWAEDMDRLLPLRDKSLKLTQIEDSMLDSRPVVGIKVEAPEHRPVRLYFDKETGLLVKREQEVLGNDGAMTNQSVVFADFVAKDGFKHWSKISAYRNGKKFISATVKELEIGKRIDEGEFVQPK